MFFLPSYAQHGLHPCSRAQVSTIARLRLIGSNCGPIATTSPSPRCDRLIDRHSGIVLGTLTSALLLFDFDVVVIDVPGADMHGEEISEDAKSTSSSTAAIWSTGETQLSHGACVSDLLRQGCLACCPGGVVAGAVLDSVRSRKASSTARIPSSFETGLPAPVR